MTLNLTFVILRMNNINEKLFLLVNDLLHVLVHLVEAEIPWAHCEIVFGWSDFTAQY